MTKFRNLLALGLMVFVASAFNSPEKTLKTYTSNYENVLGTSLELKFKARSEAEATRAEAMVLSEIDRLDLVLSAYKTSSEFSRWMNNGLKTTKISKELYEVLKQFDDYKELTRGALNPSAEGIGQIWKQAERANEVPTAAVLHTAVQRVKQKHYILNAADQSVTRLDNAPLALNSFAKSYIISKVAEQAMKQTGIEQVVVNVGGDLVVKGSESQQIAIADPKADAENAAPLATIQVADLAVATSGNYRRGYLIDGKWYSHIVDPRTGRPASEIISATVIAKDASEAGALATSFNILSVKEIEQLAESIHDFDYLLVTKDGKVLKSEGWKKYEVITNHPEPIVPLGLKADKTWNTRYELIVNLEIAQIEGTRVRRPFVAVWVENEAKTPVRNLAIWYNRPRWLPDLKSWNRSNGDEFKKGSEGKLSTTSSATRGPGKYSLAWDGKDDAGNLVKAGEYAVYIEVAREHGTYQILSQTMKFTGTAKKIELTPNTELASASLDYRKITTPKK